MSGFRDKGIFIWHPELIAGGDPAKITKLLVDAGFESAYLHTTNGYAIPTTNGVERFGMALVMALKAAGLIVYGWGAVYGIDVEREALLAADQVRRFGLAGHIFDAETGWESRVVDGVKVLRPEAPANTRQLLTRFRQLVPSASIAWCWWPLIYAPAAKTPYHPAAILTAAMETADVGMPMAYWSWGDDAANAVRYLNEVWAQWRKYTSKPMVIAGRACTGDGGTARPDAVRAFDARARELGAVGMTWWDMWHALDAAVVPGVWEALRQTPKMGQQPQEPEPPVEGNMWESNALIAAFNGVGSNPPPATIDFAALKAAGIHAVILRAGTSNDSLNYDQPDAGYRDDVNFPAWFQAATAAGLRVLVDYDFNAMLDSVNDWNGSVTLRHINFLLSGGKKPAKGGALLLNCERNTWKESTRVVTCVSSMYAKDLQNVYSHLWDAHKLVGGIRTGRWFLDLKDTGGVTIASQIPWVDTANQVEDRLPLFLARWKKTDQLVTGDFHQVVADIPDPAVTYVKVGEDMVLEQAQYLWFANHSKWRGWELATVKHAAVKSSSGQPALFRLVMWRGNAADFDAYFNFPAASVPDTTPPAVPAGLAAITTPDAVYLTWSVVADAAHYLVFADGQPVATVSIPAWSDLDLAPGSYVYEVQAVDAAGNKSAKSSPLTVVISGSSTPVVDLSAVMAALERLEAGQALIAAEQAAMATEVTEIRSHFKP